MGSSKSQAIPANLARAQASFSTWRRARKPGTRIPESLWRSAVEQAMAHGASRTATVLGLDYYGLKRRVREQEQSQAPAMVPSPEFVALSMPASNASGECVLELEDGFGARMRVQLKGCQLPDLVTLGRSFWNAQ